MQDIKIREDKIKEKRKHTQFRDFLKELASRCWLSLYRKKWFLSRYPETDRIGQEVLLDEFEKRRDDMVHHWIAYSGDFLQDFSKLFTHTQLPPIIQAFENTNCEFADHVYGAKNAYLSFMVAYNSENILYSYHIKENCINILNSVMARNGSNNVYFGMGIINGYNIFFSKFIFDSSDIRFSTNLMWCSECLFCNNLQNQSYCIENKQYTKEEYMQQKEKLLRQKERFLWWYLKLPVEWDNFASIDAHGSFVIESEQAENSYMWYHLKNTRNTVLVWGTWWVKNAFDALVWWSPSAGDCYGTCHCGGNSMNAYSTYCLFGWCTNSYYSYFLEACSNCLGCIGLKNKSFCILNTQYTKEEWFEKANEIFAQMDKDWTLGKYLPATMNPFYFNDTLAYLIDDTFTKEEVTKEWYLRRDEEIKVDVPAWAEVIGSKDFASYQWFNDKGEREIDPKILKKVIKDEKWNIYRIIPMELEFLQKYSLPLPEIHRLERIKLGFKFK